MYYLQERRPAAAGDESQEGSSLILIKRLDDLIVDNLIRSGTYIKEESQAYIPE